MDKSQVSTGLLGLDRIIGGVLPGDNIVWQVDDVQDCLPFIRPFCDKAIAAGKKLIYFRFATHPQLVADDSGARICRLDPEIGFESFLFQVHEVIEQTGRGAFYLFDCLSELVADWYSDQMLGNFFLLTCPYLYDLETVTYFPILRHHHSSYALSPIIETAQVVLSVHRVQSETYLRPLKVLHRYSPTMNMLHAWKGAEFVPVAESAVISEVVYSTSRPQLQAGSAQLDIWHRTFLDAQREHDSALQGTCSILELDRTFHHLLHMAIARGGPILDLCKQYLTIADLLEIGSRVIGTGLIGGKSVGMLLARAILKKISPRWDYLLEKHDSFYVASDVFYTYLVRNGCWWGRENQRNPETFLKGASEIRRQVLRGSFPDFILKQFSTMLDHFGQSPLIVRSSSLLEDSFGYGFAGKYESVFCASQGPESKRMEDFLSAVRRIYASAMSEEALSYRARRGLLDQDEQMALLVQRVSGSMNKNLFYPHLAGVGLSFNPYAWSPEIDPEAGVLRLVFGLGTRAVDRRDDEYTRLVALNAPNRQPGAAEGRAGRYVQKKVDVLDLGANQLISSDFAEVVAESPKLDLERFATRDAEIERYASERDLKDVFSWRLTFEGMLTDSTFVADMREALRIIAGAYRHPLELEFTANVLPGGEHKINVLQCRPLQLRRAAVDSILPERVEDEACILKTHGAVVGQSRLIDIRRLIYVSPEAYSQLPDSRRYAVARLIGEITRLPLREEKGAIMLVGPGRWGTAMPSLGVPVSFREISKVSVLCEIVYMNDNLVPDVSLGTHFFHELVEMDMLYLALFPDNKDNFLNRPFLTQAANRLAELLPSTDPAFLDTVKVIDVEQLPGPRRLRVYADTIGQKSLCCFEKS